MQNYPARLPSVRVERKLNSMPTFTAYRDRCRVGCLRVTRRSTWPSDVPHDTLLSSLCVFPIPSARFQKTASRRKYTYNLMNTHTHIHAREVLRLSFHAVSSYRPGRRMCLDDGNSAVALAGLRALEAYLAPLARHYEEVEDRIQGLSWLDYQVPVQVPVQDLAHERRYSSATAALQQRRSRVFPIVSRFRIFHIIFDCLLCLSVCLQGGRRCFVCLLCIISACLIFRFVSVYLCRYLLSVCLCESALVRLRTERVCACVYVTVSSVSEVEQRGWGRCRRMCDPGAFFFRESRL